MAKPPNTKPSPAISQQLYLDLLIAMTAKDFKARYKRAVFGFIWVIANPLIQMLVITAIFSHFINAPVINYPLFVFSGLLLWNFFSLSLLKATPSIVNERGLIQKAAFNRNLIPFSIVTSNAIHLLISYSILLGWAAFSNQLHLGSFLLLLLGSSWVFILTIGLSLLTSSLNVWFRDITFFLQISLQILFYASPILYPVSLLPAHFTVFFQLNPLTVPLMLTQSSVLRQPFNLEPFLIPNALITLMIAVFGYLLFSKKSPNFVDWV